MSETFKEHDLVTIVAGDHKGIYGSVSHIHENSLWIEVEDAVTNRLVSVPKDYIRHAADVGVKNG